MWFYLFLLFVVLPWAELMVLLRIGHLLGLPQTFAIVILTGIAGAALARQQGMSVMARARAELEEGRVPAQEVVDGFLILAAGLLLITPGIITDTAGLLLLLPLARAAFRHSLVRALKHHCQISSDLRFVSTAPSSGGRATEDNDVIDVTAEVCPDDTDE